MSATVQPSAVARGWAERRGLLPRRVRRNHAGRLAPQFANVRPAKFVLSSGGGMGLREGAPEETHRDSHQPPLPSAVYNPNQGKTKGDDGKSKIQAIDLETLEYGDQPSVKLASIGAARAKETSGEKLAEIYLGPYVGGAIENWFAYMLALAFLLFRPQGLFGEKIIERV